MTPVPKIELQYLHRRIRYDGCPLTVYEKLYQDESYGFIYESLESLEKRGRYSVIGSRPYMRFESRGKHIRIRYAAALFEMEGDPYEILRQLVPKDHPHPDVMPLPGGAVGYMAYDTIRYVENIPDSNPDELNVQDMIFVFPSELIIFDHQEWMADIIIYDQHPAQERMTQLVQEVATSLERPDVKYNQSPYKEVPISSNFTKEEFCSIVERAKEYILAGDIFQVVLSQRFTFPLHTDPLNAYRAVRFTNPSPYMYYMHLDDFHVLGSSPEIMVKLTGTEVNIKPLAGTRRRGNTEKEDEVFSNELIHDEKERAEHVMLLDLARNDIGRVCDYGSIRWPETFYIEYYSKVMHLVSDVYGKLSKDKDAFDLVAASFPAGTVSGSPKVRSMEIIDELENVRRGVYAGSIGYFGFNGDMDMCIAIRTLLLKDGKGILQAGAGIVADSIPEMEYKETMNKARALVNAVEMMGG
ncbi:anthranilate synthase component I [bacterium]|nr:anthranilate synthase component I [bacterium]